MILGTRQEQNSQQKFMIPLVPVLVQLNWPPVGVEFCECLAFYAISKNLVTYLTNVLHESSEKWSEEASAGPGRGISCGGYFAFVEHIGEVGY